MNFPSKKKSDLHYFVLTNGHNSGTKYTRDMTFVSKCVVLDTLLYSTNTSISTKSGFRKWAVYLMKLICSVHQYILFGQHVYIMMDKDATVSFS